MDDLKDFTDVEFELVFIDAIYKKLKQLDKPNIRTETLLYMYLSIIDTLKKFKELAASEGRSIIYPNMVEFIIETMEKFLESIADDESNANYVSKSIDVITESVKELLLVLKKDLTELPKYSYLKR